MQACLQHGQTSMLVELGACAAAAAKRSRQQLLQLLSSELQQGSSLRQLMATNSVQASRPAPGLL